MKDTISVETWALEILERAKHDAARALGIMRNELTEVLRDELLRGVIAKYVRPAKRPIAQADVVGCNAYEMAQATLDRCRGDAVKAEEELSRIAADTPQWEQEKSDALARAAISRAVRMRNEQTMRAARNTKQHGSVRDTLVKVGYVYDEYRIGSKLLKKFTSDELRDHINLLQAQGRRIDRDIEFFTRVLKGMKPGKTVGDCWNRSDLQDLAMRHNVLDRAA